MESGAALPTVLRMESARLIANVANPGTSDSPVPFIGAPRRVLRGIRQGK
jgi:hypothetical protein